MIHKSIFLLGIFLLFFGVMAVGTVIAATESDFTRGYLSQTGWTDLSSLDKSSAISLWNNTTDEKSYLISNLPGSPLADMEKYIQEQKERPIEWDPAFMSRTLRYAHYVPRCNL
jgi:hypothetical protein